MENYFFPSAENQRRIRIKHELNVVKTRKNSIHNLVYKNSPLNKNSLYKSTCRGNPFLSKKSAWQQVWPYFNPPIMSSGLTHSSNCAEVTKPKTMAASRKLVPSLCAFLAMAAAFS